MARRKATAVDAPQNLSEALPLLGEYARLEAIISQADAERERGIATLNDDYNALAAPLVNELAALTLRIKAWFEANRSQLTNDKRKSIAIGGCEIGHRTGNPTLKMPKGMDEALTITWLKLQDASWARALIRITETLDKAAMIRVLRLNSPSMATMWLTEAEYRTGQREQFFIQSTVPKPDATIEIPLLGTVQ